MCIHLWVNIFPSKLLSVDFSFMTYMLRFYRPKKYLRDIKSWTINFYIFLITCINLTEKKSHQRKKERFTKKLSHFDDINTNYHLKTLRKWRKILFRQNSQYLPQIIFVIIKLLSILKKLNERENFTTQTALRQY